MRRTPGANLSSWVFIITENSDSKTVSLTSYNQIFSGLVRLKHPLACRSLQSLFLTSSLLTTLSSRHLLNWFKQFRLQTLDCSAVISRRELTTETCSAAEWIWGKDWNGYTALFLALTFFCCIILGENCNYCVIRAAALGAVTGFKYKAVGLNDRLLDKTEAGGGVGVTTTSIIMRNTCDISLKGLYL